MSSIAIIVATLQLLSLAVVQCSNAAAPAEVILGVTLTRGATVGDTSESFVHVNTTDGALLNTGLSREDKLTTLVSGISAFDYKDQTLYFTYGNDNTLYAFGEKSTTSYKISGVDIILDVEWGESCGCLYIGGTAKSARYLALSWNVNEPTVTKALMNVSVLRLYGADMHVVVDPRTEHLYVAYFEYTAASYTWVDVPLDDPSKQSNMKSTCTLSPIKTAYDASSDSFVGLGYNYLTSTANQSSYVAYFPTFDDNTMACGAQQQPIELPAGPNSFYYAAAFGRQSRLMYYVAGITDIYVCAHSFADAKDSTCSSSPLQMNSNASLFAIAAV